MAEPLNRALYEALHDVFGEVKISNEGTPFRGRVIKEAAPDSGEQRNKLLIDVSGEYYMVNCPKCKDTRFRLWVNHMWNTQFQGMRLRHLFTCYNENCEQDWEFRKAFKAAVTARAPITTVRRQTTPPKEVELTWPGRCIPLHKLPSSHVAVSYMRSRGFDPVELGEVWNVAWCEYCKKGLPRNNRIVFPLMGYDAETGKVKYMGSQSRYFNISTGSDQPNKAEGEVKWFTQTGTKKSRALYNGYRAIQNPAIVVIAEGPLDVIRIGPEHGVALWGKSMSSTQAQVLLQQWAARGAMCVLALDPDAMITTGKEKESAVARARRLLKGWDVHLLKLPDGKDAGDCTPEEIWTEIAKMTGGLMR